MGFTRAHYNWQSQRSAADSKVHSVVNVGLAERLKSANLGNQTRTPSVGEKKNHIVLSLQDSLKSFQLLKGRKSHFNLQSGFIYPPVRLDFLVLQ